MENLVKAFFSEIIKNTSLQEQFDPIWSRYEASQNETEAVESLRKVINFAGAHGYNFTIADLDDVMQASMADDFLKIQSGECELSDADLDLICAGKTSTLLKWEAKVAKDPSLCDKWKSDKWKKGWDWQRFKYSRLCR